MPRLKTLAPMIILFLAATAALNAQDAPAWGSVYGPGNIVPGIGLAIEEENGLVMALKPSVECIVWKPVIGNVAPLDFGLSAMGRVALPLSGAGFQLGLGAGGTVHVGFRGFDFPGSRYLDKVDLFARFGIGWAFTPSDGPGLVGYSSSGLDYHLSERLFLGLAYSQWGYYGGVTLSGGIRLGPSPAVSGMGSFWDDSAAAVRKTADRVFLARFYAYYLASFYTGGFYLPADYEVGEGTVYRIRDDDPATDDGVFYIERALLAIEADGSQWWRLEYYQGDDRISYEFRMAPDTKVTELYYREGGGATVRMIPAKDDIAAYYADARTAAEMPSKARAKERVKVGAGTYQAATVVEEGLDDDGRAYRHSWWLSADVPGGLVQYVQSAGDDSFTLTLNAVTRDNRFELRR